MSPTYSTPDGSVSLYLGDCLDVLPTLAGVDAVVTDPPWNCGFFGQADDVPWREYKGVLTQWLCACERLCDGQCWFLSTKSITHVADLFDGYKPFASAKNFSQMTRHSLPNCWDIAFIRDTQKAYRGNGRNWFVCNTAGMLKERTEHPTPRTVDVMDYILSMFNWQSILDPFMGSGTTGVACVKTGRRFIGVEKEPKYFDIAVKRIEKAIAERGLYAEVA